MRRASVMMGKVYFVGVFVAVALFMGGTSALAQDDGFSVGGALRYNYFVKSWDDANKSKGGDVALDTFRFNIDGSYGDIGLSAEYRFYAGYHMLHHGYLSYDFTDATSMQLGVHQVPFGIQTYASHNWFFSMAYYLGLEDDYDAGIKVIHDGGPWDLKLAFYKNSEGSFTGRLSQDSARYSYDVVSDAAGTSNSEETNQVNGRFTYTLDQPGMGTTELGISAQFGQLYNSVLDESGDHMALGLHADGNYGPVNVQLFGMHVDHNPEVTAGNDDSVVIMGAYDATYQVASTGNVYGLGASYALPVDIGPISMLTFYNDFSMYQKDEDSFNDTLHNITGVMVTAGSVYTYIDLAQGQNNPWVGGPWTTGLAKGVEDPDWETRFNVNVGYYF